MSDALKTILAVIGAYAVVGVSLSVWQFFKGDKND